MTNKAQLKLIEKISKSTYKLHDLLKEKPVVIKKKGRTIISSSKK